jgi:hypothetical protein
MMNASVIRARTKLFFALKPIFLQLRHGVTASQRHGVTQQTDFPLVTGKKYFGWWRQEQPALRNYRRQLGKLWSIGAGRPFQFLQELALDKV